LSVRVISNPDDQKVRNEVGQEVAEMCRRFPVPGIDD
jgi:hypothetical protein